MTKLSKIVSLGLIAACSFTLVGCLNDIEQSRPNNNGDLPLQQECPYVEGELIVKFSPAVEQMLASRKVISRSDIPSVDEVLEAVGGYELERVFPYDKRSEEASRERGLHLWYVVRFSGESTESVAAKLDKLGEVQKVDLNRRIKRAYNGKVTPLRAEALSRAAATRAGAAAMNDPLLGEQWNLINNGNLFLKDGVVKSIKDADVQVEEAWKLSTGHEDVIVAVLDEGVCVDHPDLKANMWVNSDEVAGSHEDNDANGYVDDIHGYNFVRDSGKITWDNYLDSGHGSHVAGVISAVNNNGIGVSSIAGGDNGKGGVKIMSCQIFSGQMGSSVLAVARAMKYAADNGAVVLQCSWGYVSGAANEYDWGAQGFHSLEEWKMGSPLEFEALDYFIHNAGSPNGPINGGVAVFAGGNESAPQAGYPGAADFAVSVAATAADFTPAVYTNYGPGTTISAPGGDQDYYWDYVDEAHNYGEVGCILSTLPYNVSESGYGWMEGTSMACPHISGVVALAISYAAEQCIQLTPDQIKELLCSTAVDIDPYMVGKKEYRRYVADIGPLQPMQMDLAPFKGQMGAGQVNATRMLQAIAGVGTPIHFPNIYIEEGGSVAIKASRYFVDGDKKSYKVTIANEEVATCRNNAGELLFEGKKVGTTTATISVTSGSTTEQHSFTITVRKGAGNNGWL
ncbi:MAG: S8 family serine peptidase [Tidjanibacter sp.]|nr:S8 family serine peptidase [Tidjanibacter sp.]